METNFEIFFQCIITVCLLGCNQNPIYSFFFIIWTFCPLLILYFFLSFLLSFISYRYLPRAAGLRRIALHKSTSQKGDKMYLLVCECADLLKDITSAAVLIPALRARLCGYTGLYRPIQAFWVFMFLSVFVFTLFSQLY